MLKFSGIVDPNPITPAVRYMADLGNASSSDLLFTRVAYPAGRSATFSRMGVTFISAIVPLDATVFVDLLVNGIAVAGAQILTTGLTPAYTTFSTGFTPVTVGPTDQIDFRITGNPYPEAFSGPILALSATLS